MSSEMLVQNVEIMDSHFRFQCPVKEAALLQQCAQYVDAKLREIKSQGKVVHLDQIATMTAVNIAHELLTEREERARYIDAMGAEIRDLRKKLERALAAA